MSIKLLVADDSITIQKVIGIIFGSEDYSLTVVDNGKSAIEKAREICPDVLLIDALMPGMTGYEVAEAVRATPALVNKPILILTGSFEPFDEDKARKCGADDFLAKPFESQQIVNKVRELAELGASRERTSPAAQPPVSTPPAIPTVFPETTATPVAFKQTETAQTIAPTDIWGAFTTDTKSHIIPPTDTTQVVSSQHAESFEFTSEPDVFAIVNEETDSQLVQPAGTPSSSPQNAGSQWIPVEEHSFEFEEEPVPDVSTSELTQHALHAPDYSFGNIAFEDDKLCQPPVLPPVVETETPVLNSVEPAFAPFVNPTPAFATPIAHVEETAKPVQTVNPDYHASETPAFTEVPSVATSTASLTEDQLKAAISAASKDVIERIVWEVVPDLAEALIKEAIRKIREGL